MPRWEYDRLVELIDLRPWKKLIEERWPHDSLIAKLAKLESDSVRRYEWEYTSVIYFMVMTLDPPPTRPKE